MYRFHASIFLRFAHLLKDFSYQLVEAKKELELHGHDPDAVPVNGGLAEKFLTTIAPMQKHLASIRLNFSANGVRKLITYMSQHGPISMNKLKSLTEELNDRVVEELADRKLFLIRSDRADFYGLPNTFLGEKLIHKFPEFPEDASEAGNCFALSRYTACMFHLMRIMEAVVQRFGRKVKVPIDVKNENWDKIVKQIKKLTEIDSKDSQKIKLKKKRYQLFYDRLDAVRVAWRNPTMHPKSTYTEEEAKEVMDAVKNLINDFSTLR